MFIRNSLAAYGAPLDSEDRMALGVLGSREVARFLAHRDGHRPTPLLSLSAAARELGVGSIRIKDEAHRLGLGSFKALGGAYAVIRLAIEAASERLGRAVDIAEWRSPAVADTSAHMTVACATDGNHGRSVAQGAQLVGARCVIFVHAGVSAQRAAAIARFGATLVRVEGTYGDSVAEAARQADANGWTLVSDTSWPGYERIPRLVMQGYTAMLQEAADAMPEPPTHVFVQSGVGGVAAAAAAFLAEVYGVQRPVFTVVDPSLAACLFESARAGHPVKVAPGEPTVMAMLACYEPSLIAWRILSRLADAFMTVEDTDATGAMRRLAHPTGPDPVIVAGESGGVGLAALIKIAANRRAREALRLGPDARVFLINTEGATDPLLYEQLVGSSPDVISSNAQQRHPVNA